MSRARVMITADAVGGVWTYAVDLARGLADAGVATLLVVTGPAVSPPQKAEARAIPGLNLVDTALPLDWTATEPAEVLEVGALLRGLARGEGVDLVHLNSPALAAAGPFHVPTVGVCHSCVATWWAAVRAGPMPADFAWRSRLVWQGLLACHALIAPTRAFAEATRRTHDIRPMDVVWNGRRAPPAGTLRPRRMQVLTAGRLWDEGKNIAVLDAAAALTRIPVCAAGALTGPGGARQSLRHAVPLGLLSEADMRAALEESAVYATSALYEPFGLGVLEAAQAGCALVLSDIDTFRELWDGAALFADPRDPRTFAMAFETLGQDPALRMRLARAARTRAARYSLEQMVAGTLRIYGRAAPHLLVGEAA